MSPRYLARRIAIAAVLLLLLTVVTFVIFFEIPANPAGYLIDVQHSTPDKIAAADHALGTDRPVYVQYVRFVERIAHGDFGDSWSSLSIGDDGQLHGAPVRSMIASGFAVTASVVVGGAVLLLLVSVPLGAIAARRPRSAVDRTLTAATLVGISTHPLVVGLVLESLFAERWRLVPFGGYCPLRRPATPAGVLHAPCGGAHDWAMHLLLPWATFALFFAALYLRMIRARLLEVLGAPFVQTARAKGASEWRIISHHVSRVAFAPLVPMIAMDVGAALGISLYLETVFQLPGLGRATLLALNGDRGFDLPLMLGIVVVTATVIIVLNLLADIAASAVDPTLASR